MENPIQKECPDGGSGVHNWVFHAACRCVDAGLEDTEAEELITSLMTRTPTPGSEVQSALDSARRTERGPSTKWPKRDINLIQEIFQEPEVDWKPLDIDPEKAIDILFPGNPLLCVGKTSAWFNTKPREEWRGGMLFNSLIVPSPMSALQGRTKAGHLSAHSLDNTGPRKYLVIEFDWGLFSNQLRLHKHLSKFARLTAVVHSGGKSVHAWYHSEGRSEEQLMDHFMRYAVSIGADPRTWLKSQFVRLPGGTRDTGERQHIYFLDEKTIKS